jgi:hypothetical protein
MAKKIIIHDPVLSEIAFDYLYTMSVGQRQKLNAKELRGVKSAKKARAFIEKTTLDEKLFLLAKLGCGFSIIFHNGNPLSTKEVKSMYEKYKDMARGDIVKDMAEKKIAVTSDRVLINFLNILADLSHSDTYLLNLDFHKVGHFLNNWKPENRPDIDATQQSLDYAKSINKFALNVSLELKTIKGVFELADLDFNILMMLYDKRTKYVSRDAIDEFFGGLYKKILITAAIKRLSEKVLIERNPVARSNEYQITAMGNTAVMDFHKKNLANTV